MKKIKKSITTRNSKSIRNAGDIKVSVGDLIVSTNRFDDLQDVITGWVVEIEEKSYMKVCTVQWADRSDCDHHAYTDTQFYRQNYLYLRKRLDL